jgi:hypothetical protein
MPPINQICQASGQKFIIDERDQKFYNWIRVPFPTLSPLERWRRRVAFRNDKNFFKSTCGLCNKQVISIYSGQRNFPIYCYNCFWSDNWDPLAYGVDFDFTRLFFDQYYELQSKVPRLALFNSKSINSEYTVHSMENKNCYMGGSIGYSEDVLYSNFAISCKNCVDCYDCTRCEQCYWCVGSVDCYNSSYLDSCEDVKDSIYCFDCRSSSNLIACIGLRHREYVVLNQNVSKEQFTEIEIAIAQNPEYRKKMESHFEELKAKYPKRAAYNINVENSSGNYLNNCKNTLNSFNCEDTEDCRYIQNTHKSKNTYDTSNNMPSELVYEGMGIVDLNFSMFCFLSYYSNNIIYGDNIQNSQYCFGSISLKKQQHVILNKKYSKEDYDELVQKIIEHMKKTPYDNNKTHSDISNSSFENHHSKFSPEWGQFFPIKYSPIPYNESVAQEIFPLSKEQTLSRGYTWNDATPTRDPEVIASIQVPIGKPISQIASSVTKEAHTCISCQKPFGITPQELKFYQQHGITIPVMCPVCRHMKRKASRNPKQLFNRQCNNCQTNIQTTVPEPEEVNCEQCYLKAIY